MIYLFVLVTAMAISMAIIPAMMRLAPLLGLMDLPDPRKVHAKPIPRVGGLGIVLGSLIPVLMLAPRDKLLIAYSLGCVILFVFGLWDDRREIGHYWKFLGQCGAAFIVIFYGDLYITSIPLLDGVMIPKAVSIPFTIFAIVGMINAVNHSDGLDGLAGGETFVSFGVIAFLVYSASGTSALVVALAALGGILGFLRYNTHPAWVFMGDAGSQFLGFTLGFLLIVLTQRVNPDLSPALVLPLVGLPVPDILIVLAKRMREGRNWFKATRNHVHHRLLDLGFVHRESVLIIYSVQMVFMTSALMLRNQSDSVILAVYFGICVAVFGLLAFAESRGWQVRRDPGQYRFPSAVVRASAPFLVVVPRRVLRIGIPVFMLGTSVWVQEVPKDFGVVAAVVFALLLLELVWGRATQSILQRGLVYVTASFVAFLASQYGTAEAPWLGAWETAYFAVVLLSIWAAVKFSPKRRRVEFRTTALDVLILLVALLGLATATGHLIDRKVATLVVEMLILFYGCEVLLTEQRQRVGILSLASLASVLVLCLRSLT
jgi:UDP-GlcNAc:undecaprenyl-phosphate GlcNAc-1-phosphate transferase